MDHGQTKPGALGPLGGEKRIEYPHANKDDFGRLRVGAAEAVGAGELVLDPALQAELLRLHGARQVARQHAVEHRERVLYILFGKRPSGAVVTPRKEVYEVLLAVELPPR